MQMSSDVEAFEREYTDREAAYRSKYLNRSRKAKDQPPLKSLKAKYQVNWTWARYFARIFWIGLCDPHFLVLAITSNVAIYYYAQWITVSDALL